MPAWSTRDRRTLPIDNGRLLLDGRPLGQYGVWAVDTGIELDLAEAVTSYTEIPGRISADLSLEDESGHAILQRRTITIHLVTAGTYDECRDSVALVAALAGKTTTIEDRQWGGYYEGRCSGITTTEKPLHGAILIDLTIDADPLLIGPTQTRQITAGDNKIAPGGNRPAHPNITLTATALAEKISVSDGERTWSITPATPYKGGETLTLDTQLQHTTLNGQPAAPDLTADWPILLPKQTTVTLTGATGAITWQPRTAR